MPSTLSCYYLDEPLAEEEFAFAERTLIGPWARFRTRAAGLVQKRVPAVLPLPDESGRYQHTREQRAARMRANLRHAGIREDRGRQVVWVMPHDSEWDAIFQYAIREETGFGPWVAQRWYDEGGVLVRRELRLVDTQMLLSRL
ncbi:hypothetical protein [Noviherbaspirillum aridicola]|uniref:Uncharacterized protein n=1 Tax=Noviherbaspirillum aridicola TaxID=2849687 RepID=A0ABQ4Q881_9BURK|nr:hypothetical protein [Noviherbaspirillum aridicola]GIZ53122.1 hypothetical protein NCCP691_31360 [Noviherbaspirillum aridicola]